MVATSVQMTGHFLKAWQYKERAVTRNICYVYGGINLTEGHGDNLLISS